MKRKWQISKKKVKIQSSLALALILLISSCHLFEPRKSELPFSEADWNQFPILAEQALENLLFSYEYSENIERYHTVLTDDFRFYFDVQDVQNYSLPEYWTKEEEIFTRVVFPHGFEDLVFSGIESKTDILLEESAVYYRHYSFQYDNTHYQGNMTLNLVKESDGFWRIEHWQDYRNEGNTNTWGRIKYEYGQISTD